MKKTIWMVCFAVSSAVLAASVCLPREAGYPPSSGDTGEPDRPEQWAHGLGTIEPQSEVRRLVFRGSGVVHCCRVAIGDKVRRGDLLMTLHNEAEKASVKAADRDWGVAVAERDKVLSGINPCQIAVTARRLDVLREQARFRKRELMREGSLAARQAASDVEHQQARTEAVQAEANLAQAAAELDHLQHFVTVEDRQLAEAKVELAAARLELTRRQVEDTELRAPCDGVVLEILRREGEGVRPTDTEATLVLADLSRLVVRAEIDERFVHAVRAGQRAVVSGRGLGDASFTGRIALAKRVMGKKTVFARSAAERKDLSVMEVLVEIDGPFTAPIGLEVNVKICTGAGQ